VQLDGLVCVGALRMSPQEEYHYTLALENFDVSLLPPEARTLGTPAFREAASRFLQGHFEGFGGRATIAVASEQIEVHWTPSSEKANPLTAAISMLEKGEYAPAVLTLRFLLSVRPDDVEVLYNLGMALSDTGQLDEAVSRLQRAVELAPTFADARIALGTALQRQGKDAAALDAFKEAVAQKPDNSTGQRNYGACLLKTGKMQEAVEHLRKAMELDSNDQQTWFGLAQACEGVEDWKEADEAYQKVISLDEFNDIAEAARKARTGIARRFLHATGTVGVRMDGVMYCLEALREFEKMTPDEVKKIAFEIAMVGRTGLSLNDSTPKYRLKSMQGEFSGLHLACFMYVGFKQLMPDADLRLDLDREYAAAKAMHETKGKK